MSVKKIFKVGEVVDDLQAVVRAVGRRFKGRRNTTVVPKNKGGQPKKTVVPKNKGGQPKETVVPKPKIKKETLSPEEKKIKAEVGANPSNAGARAKKTILDKRNEPAPRYIDAKSNKASDRDKAVTFAAGAAAVPLLVTGLSPASGGRKNEGGDFLENTERRAQESVTKPEGTDNKNKPVNKKTGVVIEDRTAAAILDRQPKKTTSTTLDPSIVLSKRSKEEPKNKTRTETKARGNEIPKATPVVSPELFKKTMGTSFDPKSKMDQDKKKSLEKFITGNVNALKNKSDTQIALAYYRTLKK